MFLNNFVTGHRRDMARLSDFALAKRVEKIFALYKNRTVKPVSKLGYHYPIGKIISRTRNSLASVGRWKLTNAR